VVLFIVEGVFVFIPIERTEDDTYRHIFNLLFGLALALFATILKLRYTAVR